MTPDLLAITCDAARWGEALSRPSQTPEARAFRRELGLDDTRPLVMSGHQPWLWYPGILAKVAALGAAGRVFDAATAWAWVDQDSLDPGGIAYPTLDEAGTLKRASWRIAPAPSADVALASLSPWGANDLALAPAGVHPQCEPDRLARTRRALAAAAAAPSLGAQWARTLEALCIESGFPLGASEPAQAIGVPAAAPPATFLATSIARTTEFQRLLHDLAENPARAVETYNAAVALDPGAGIRPLETSEDLELPLWWLAPGKPRRPVFVRELGARLLTIQPGDIAPRALLMTGLLRQHACELFIHGKGGGRYDQITDHWFREWLGVSLAPTTVVSADLRLPLLDGPVPDARDVAQARALAHRARHDPALLGDRAGGEAKRAAVAQIARLRAVGGDPAPVFAGMHRALAAARHAAPGKLEALEAEAARVAARFAQREVALARDWPWVLAPAEALSRLAEGIEGRVRHAGAVR